MMTHPLAATGEHPFRRVWSQVLPETDAPSEQDDWFEEFDEDEWELWDEFYDHGPRAEPSPVRRGIIFAVIALLLVTFSLIVFWGLAGSDWLYGTYGQIDQDQWDQIADLRDRLVHLDLAPKAVDALNDALLLPHPATEIVLSDLARAAQALDPFVANATVRQIRAELYTVIAEIDASYGPDHTPWSPPRPHLDPSPTPTMDGSVT